MMNIARDVTHEVILSHDELMLKELERRDGIYSFIFHELESPKTTLTAGTTHELTTTNTTKQILLEAHATELQAAFSTTSTTTTISATTIHPHNGPLLPTVHSGASTLSTATMPAAKQYHEFLRAWQPPASLVYEHPKLYAYMVNCGFRVRVATPRFSHISVPLVRNRRHALKDAPEYKRCDMCNLKIADLRVLFPHDPDVHAPFVEAFDGTEQQQQQTAELLQ